METLYWDVRATTALTLVKAGQRAPPTLHRRLLAEASEAEEDEEEFEGIERF